MAVNLKKYAQNPKAEFANKLRKMRMKMRRRIGVTKEFLAGNYTSKTIAMDWTDKPLRSQLINRIIEINGYRKYLEIGCRDNACFDVIRCEYKVGVDPNSGGTLRMTSDEFFEKSKETFDIIFIDGLHTYEQVRLDIINSMKVLNEGGTIIMHDCLPLSCLAQYQFPVIDAWNGDVWKAFVEARTYPDLDAATCLIDHGVGVLKKRRNADPLTLPMTAKKLNYAFLVDDYQRLLNTINYDQALDFTAEKILMAC